MAEEKKISFSFGKLKKPNLLSAPKKPEKESVTGGIQLIDCLEAQTIKIIGVEEEKEKPPLVIPMPQNRNRITINVDESDKPTPETNGVSTENGDKKEEPGNEKLTLEEIAAQELVNDSKNKTPGAVQPKVFTITKLTENGQITGEPESTMEDYENIPINEFGMALLRGMGWKEEKGIGKNAKTSTLNVPNIRPKGMGLGADKMILKQGQSQETAKKGSEELKIIKGAYVRVISGRHKNKFGKILGFDEDAGSVIIKMALDGSTESLQEFLISPISKEVYDKDSKVLNLEKFEEYKYKKDAVKQEKPEKKVKPTQHDAKDSDSDIEYIGTSQKIEKIKLEPEDRVKYDDDTKYSKKVKDERLISDSKTTEKSDKYSRTDSEDRQKRHRKRSSEDDDIKLDRKNKHKKSKHRSKSSDDEKQSRKKDKYREKSKKSTRYDDESSEDERESRKSKKEKSKKSSKKRYESESDDSDDERESRRSKKDKYKDSSNDKESSKSRKDKKSSRKGYESGSDDESSDDIQSRKSKKDKYREKSKKSNKSEKRYDSDSDDYRKSKSSKEDSRSKSRHRY